MADRLPRFYLDSSCYIAILRGERQHLDALRRIHDDARTGKIAIVASTLCISEVVKPRGSSVVPRSQSEATIRAFFENPWMILRTHDRHIAEQGRELCWSHGLHPRDAIHIASAIDTGCSDVFTTDARLIASCAALEEVRVRLPAWSGQAPLFPEPS